MNPVMPTWRNRSLLAAVLTAGTVVGALVVGGPNGPRSPVLEGGRAVTDSSVAEAVAVDARVASGTMDRLQVFRTGNAGHELVLSAEEITALLRYSVPGLIPAGVTDPVVTLENGVVRVTARIAAADFPGTPLLAPVLEVAPDTIAVDVRGTVVREPVGLAFRIDRVSVQHLPIPAAIVASVVASLSAGHSGGPATKFGEAPDAVGATLRIAWWPDGISSMRVSGDRLVLERSGTMSERAVDGGGA